MHLPPEAFDVLDKLGSKDRGRCARELFQAVKAAQDADDLRPVTEVIEAWYRTLLVREHPRYGEMMEHASRKPAADCALTAEEVRARLEV
jgi:hypothetical protein